MVKDGYVDLDHDDYKAGTMLDRLQAGTLGENHRTASLNKLHRIRSSSDATKSVGKVQ